ncbi:Panacea domain-containing protein [Duganella radicis]|uniref:DUF4065 domain-containing protein n=1 Tax=Duganella radicis TaxID=551988 RepID=A0A6L6PG79_9BURK|nr:type II toxin-antitoxin system antitoxin SocA domain-containing protein [Duganella radicis]MTV38050.1 DUF4065 domain-containing protein [Duganella radicis]
MQLYSPKSIANYFIERAKASGEQLNPMKLQKLVYYAAGWFAGYTGKPLLNEAPQAWQYGPVFPSLYQAFKEFGSRPVSKKASTFDAQRFDFVEASEPEDSAIRQFLDNVWNSYRRYTDIALSEMSHAAGSPWDLTWRRSDGIRNVSIPFELMRDHFRLAAEKAKAGGVPA